MDMLFENADFQNDIFIREHQTALKNLHNCLTITTNLMADLQNLRHEIDHKRKQECIQLYESTMKILTSFSEIFRQFNIEIQTTSVKLDANVRDCGGGGGGGGSGGGGNNTGGMCGVNAVVTNGYGNHNYDDADIRLKEFIYPKYDMTIYKENYFGDGVVAYVEDSDKNVCFIIDSGRAYDQNLYDTLGTELNRLPLPGEVFGIDLGTDGIFRAVRDNNVNIKRKTKTMRVLLIDTGEIMETQVDTHGKFSLSECAQKIPGRSIRCKVEEIFEEDGLTKTEDTSLDHILYESMRFRVSKVQNNLLYIKVYRKGSARFDELTCTNEETLNGEHSTSTDSAIATTSHVYQNASTLNPFATEFSYKCLNKTSATFYSYQNQPRNILANVDNSPSHHHRIIDDFNHLSSHSIPYVINQNCPPLANATSAAALPLSAATTTAEYPEYISPLQTSHQSMVVHHSTPPIQLSTVPIQSVPSQYFRQSSPTATTTNVVELFPDVYQNDEASFRETNLGKYDTTSNIKRMQNHLMSGGACFVPASATSPSAILNKHQSNASTIMNTIAVAGPRPVSVTPTPVVSAAGHGIGIVNASTVDDGVSGGRQSDNRSPRTRPISDDNNCTKKFNGSGNSSSSNSSSSSSSTNGACNNNHSSGAKARTATSITANNAETDDDINDHSESSDSLSIGANYNRPKPKRDVNDLTKEQLDELYEEPMGTENALKAVMGYVPKDDRRICKHYDPKIKGCFKGNNCKLEHIHPMKDGWTRDREPAKLSIPAKLPMPALNQPIKVIPTYIVSVEEFYAQIPELAMKNGMSLIKLNEAINSAENRNRYRKYTKPPGIYELVLATYKSNYIYRAKVLDVDEQNVKLFYVDYGNCGEVALRNVYIWEDRWDHIPFQAYRCRMFGIKEVEENDVQSTKKFKNIIYNKRLTAIIINNVEELYVRLLDEDNFDIGKKLIQQNMAKSHDTILPKSVNTDRMPG